MTIYDQMVQLTADVAFNEFNVRIAQKKKDADSELVYTTKVVAGRAALYSILYS